MPAAVDQQLEQLQTDRDADKQSQDPSDTGTDLVLYRFVASLLISDVRFMLLHFC